MGEGRTPSRGRTIGLRRWTFDRASRAFTLVEVLLVLALMALVGAVLFPAANALFPKTGATIDDVVGDVFQQARREAVATGREVTLRFDLAGQRFAWEGAAVRHQAWSGPRVTIDFLRPNGGNAILLGGRLVETATVPVLRFFPDGTCDSVRVQIRTATDKPRIVSIDPWTCAPGLEVKS
jgi:prepilin-type N-terminal cleavage/methylation domain-containing protein